MRDITRHGVSKDAALQHRESCAKPVVARRLRAREITLEVLTDGLLDQREAAQLFACEARKAKDADTFAKCKEFRETSVTIAKLAGLYRESGPTISNSQINIFGSWSSDALAKLEAVIESGNETAVLDAPEASMYEGDDVS